MKGFSRKSVLIIVTTLFSGCHSAQDEGSGSSGGDGIRSVFLEAKDMAVKSVVESSSEKRLQLTTHVISQWVEQNKQTLALDIQLSKHSWTEATQPTCASTARHSQAEIILSIPSCRDDIKDTHRATFVLVHESVHHLSVEDEYFADQVARSVISDGTEDPKKDTSQSSDSTTNSSIPAEAEVEFNNLKASALDPFHVCHYQGLDHQVESTHRPDARITYFDGNRWLDRVDDIRIQKLEDSKYRILTGEFLVQTSFVQIEDCPDMDIRLNWH